MSEMKRLTLQKPYKTADYFFISEYHPQEEVVRLDQTSYSEIYETSCISLDKNKLSECDRYLRRRSGRIEDAYYDPPDHNHFSKIRFITRLTRRIPD